MRKDNVPPDRINKNIRWLTARRDALLKRLGKLGPFMGGSLVLIGRTCGNKEHCHCAKGPKHVSLYLTFAEKGKTRTIYVPVDMEVEVRRWSQSYRDLKADVAARVSRLFDLKPKADFIVEPIETFRQVSSATAEYLQPAPDGTRPGIFYVNTYQLASRPVWEREALFIHEAVPGHHFQLSIAQEQQRLPEFRRFQGPTAFVEGWGLYAETLGYELGLYQDPYQRMGALAFQIWRADRLVVDTGMHALGWTREQAIDFMMSNMPKTQTDIVAEVERYMAIPGQALAYKIGQTHLSELRAKAEKALGGKFSISDFHHQVLADGAMPLALLEQKIDRWIRSVR